MRSARRTAHPGRGLAAILVIGLLVAGCATTPRTATNFCRVLDARRAAIAATLGSDGDINRLVNDYEAIVAVAPIEVEADLRVLLELFRLAANVNTDDAEQVQRLADLSYGAEKAADDAATWVAATCGFDLSTGSVITGIAPGDTQDGG